MAVIQTKYPVGDVVYLASTNTEQKQHACPDCKGTRKWAVTSPAGEEYSTSCPRCSTSYRSHDELSLGYTAHVPTTRRLTIGSVKVDTRRGSWGNDEPVNYMCEETGVGSGNVWRESDLFETEADALQAATVKAALANETTPWIAKLYNRSLSISDYQLSSAAMTAAQEYKSRAASLLWNLSHLFSAIEDAGDKEAVSEAVAEYKAWHWESDLKELAAQVGTHPQGGDSLEAPAPLSDAVA